MTAKKYPLLIEILSVQNGQDAADILILILARYGIMIDLLIIVTEYLNGDDLLNVLVLNSSLIVVKIIAWILVVRGQGRIATLGICLGIWVVLFSSILISGIHQQAYTALIVPPLLLTLVYKRNFGFLLAVLSVVLGGCILILEEKGVLIPSLDPQEEKLKFFLVNSSLLLLLAFVGYFAVTILDNLEETNRQKEERQKEITKKWEILPIPMPKLTGQATSFLR